VKGSLVIKLDMKFIMTPRKIMGKYLVTIEKLKRKLIEISLDDHLWSLKSWDLIGVGIVKLWCGECC
jgi:hypothetical protein